MSAKTNDQPVTDDQELAKVLADNASQQKAATSDALSGLEFEEPPVPAGQNPSSTPASTPPSITPSPSATTATKANDVPAMPSLDPPASSSPVTLPGASAPATGNSSLENLKKDALEELRPLVNKLNLPADEKFDTLLLIIRSTDDQSLLTAAHDAAKAITDDSRRAQALLDVIKEIDYFSGQSAA